MIARTSRLRTDRIQKRYALLVDSFENEHEQSVIQGTLTAARELDARLLVVAGGPVDAHDERQRVHNFAFDLVGRENALGVLLLSGTLGNAVGPVRLGSWLERYADIPLCCLGVPIPGQASVLVDNAGGIKQAVRHLVQVHDKHNIGFIRGPSYSDEAEIRYAAYREQLASHGITPDPRWVAEGDYTRASGVQGVRTILDQKRVSVHALDALLCANDYMALGALDELGRRGVLVPEQMAVVGFDDVASAAAARPPLTTVHQPGAKLGGEGLRQLILGGGNTQASDRVLPVDLSIRRSCGCTSGRDAATVERAPGAPATASFEAALIQRRQLIVAELARAAHGTFGAAGADWEGTLLTALIEEMRDAKQGALSRRVQRILLRLEQAGHDLGAGPAVLATLRRHALLCASTHADARSRLEDAISEAQQVATTLLTQAAISGTRAATAGARALSQRVQERMFKSPTGVSEALAEYLPELGINACVVAALVDPGAPERTGQVCLGFAQDKGHPEQQVLPLLRLSEHSLVESARTLFLMPIALGTEPLGVAAVSVTGQQTTSELFEDLRVLLATVLKVMQLRHG